MYRLFIAVPVPEPVKSRLMKLKLNIPGAKWTPSDQIHITLKFIGEIDGLTFSDIRQKLSEIKMQSFSIILKGVGYFPPGSFSKRSGPRVLWSGLEDKENITKLRNKIENNLNKMGIGREGRKFHPHVTLARLKNTNVQKISEFISVYSEFLTEPFLIEEFRLYSSRLLSQGAVHKIEAVYQFIECRN